MRASRLLLGLLVSACATAPAPAAEAAPAGEVQPDELARWVGDHKGPIQACYQRELGRDPTLHGTVSVLFSVTSTGHTSEVGIEEDTVKDPALEDCIKAIILEWELPFRPGEDTPVAYPFVFSARSDEG